MKKLYINPEMKMKGFNKENIVTESGLTAVEKATASLNSQQETLNLKEVFVLE